jgi:hypothetical protein
MKKNRTLVSLIVGGTILVASYFSFGVVVTQPLGLIPEGASVVYFRIGTGLPLISSADGLLLEKIGSVSPFGRMMMLATISDIANNRKLFVLPYSHTLYLISTGGTEFEE